MAAIDLGYTAGVPTANPAGPFPAAVGSPATHARYGVIGFAVSLAALSYLDRIAIAQAAPLIARDLHLSTIQLGSILGIFALSYALFELPSGWLGDLFGPRRVLVRIVAGWSIFTALTGAMWNFWSLYVARFLFGAGEAGGFPNITRAMTTWLPRHERVRAQGWMWTASRWGGAAAPLLVVWLLRYMSWRWAFVVLGSLGAIWTAWFYAWYRDRPSEHPSVNAAELALMPELPVTAQPRLPLRAQAAATPWRAMLANRSVQLLCLQYFCLSFGWYFFITWFPTYLHNVFHLSLGQTAVYASWPLLFNGLGSLFCGFISVRLATWTGNVGRSRKVLAATGMFVAGAALALSAYLPTVSVVVGMMAISAFFNDWAVPTCWAACMDVGGEFAGTISGMMNTAANISGFIAATLTGFILHWTGGNWHLFILIMAAMYVPAGVSWMLLDPVTRFDAGRAA